METVFEAWNWQKKAAMLSKHSIFQHRKKGVTCPFSGQSTFSVAEILKMK